MTLFDTAQIIKRWIASCTNEEQLDLIANIIEEFVHKRFARKEPYFDLNDTIAELGLCIEQRLRIVNNQRG